MVLLNKAVLSSFSFDAPIAMLLIQCTFCAIFAFLSQAAGSTRLEPPSVRVISAMIPINVLFVGETTFGFFLMHFFVLFAFANSAYLFSAITWTSERPNARFTFFFLFGSDLVFFPATIYRSQTSSAQV